MTRITRSRPSQCPGIRFVGLFLAAAFLAVAGPAEAQVLGRVIDQANQGPVANAGVALVDSTGTVRGQVVSDEVGRFIMPIGMPGTYSVQVVALGYVANAMQEFVYQGQRIFLEVTVAPAPIETEGLEVVVESQQVHLVMAGFYDRQRMGGGDFIGPEDIERLRATRPGHLLRRFPSVTLLENQEPIFNRNQGVSPEAGTCLPNVWIDGYPIRTRNFQRVRTTIDDESGTGGEDLTANPERFDLIVPPAEMIAAIEAYPGGSSVPARWRTRSSGCGVIVVWTRRR